MIRSLVTGAAGFLGSHLVDHLIKEGHEVIALDNEANGTWENLAQWSNHPRFKKVHQDILELSCDDPHFQNLDYIFHLAGLECPISSIKNPEVFFTTNVNGTIKVLQAARQSDLKKFIFASSSSIYGVASTPTLETDSTHPLTPSGLSKLQAEEAVFHWGELFSLPTVSLRIFNAYGPRNISRLFPGSVFSLWMKQKAEGMNLTIVGNGQHARDFVYCTDVSNALYIAAIEGNDGEAYNVGSGRSIELCELATLLKSKTTSLKDLKDEPIKVWADISKFQFDCNWQPRVPIESGVAFSLDVLEDWNKAPLWDTSKLDSFFSTWFEVYS